MSHIEPDPRMTPDRHPLSDEWRASGVVDVCSVDLGWKRPSVPPAVLIAYDVEAFDVEAFERLGVAMPEHIGRSVRKRQAEFLMGRLAAREAMGGAVTIGIGDMRQPIWPHGMVGSITHAGRYAAAVVAEAPRAVASDGIHGIGIDIERRIAPETRESVEATVVTAAEQSFLRTMDAELPYDMLLTLAFSAKESFFKGSFASVGAYFDFDAVELVALNTSAGMLELVLTRSLAPALPQGGRYTLRTQCLDADTVLTSFVW